MLTEDEVFHLVDGELVVLVDGVATRVHAGETLTPFSYAILVLVGRSGAGAHDLVRMARRGRVYAAAADSQFYAEPKRLAALGYLDARTEPGRTHERTHYTLTDKGLAAVRDWAGRPVRYPRVLHEGVVRLLAADLVGEAPVRESITALREELDELDRARRSGGPWLRPSRTARSTSSSTTGSRSA